MLFISCSEGGGGGHLGEAGFYPLPPPPCCERGVVCGGSLCWCWAGGGGGVDLVGNRIYREMQQRPFPFLIVSLLLTEANSGHEAGGDKPDKQYVHTKNN